MKPHEHINLAMRTDLQTYEGCRNRMFDISLDELRAFHASIGLVTESGEIMDAWKKYFFYGKPLDQVNFIEETGDILWYVSLMLTALGMSYEEVFQKNIDKLKARYGERFSEEKALKRDLDAERKELEK